jgi:hypothetical protein
VKKSRLPKSDASPEELAFFADRAHWVATEGAYGAVHSTKPQSLAYGLNDSPAGLAAWILEKFFIPGVTAVAISRASSRETICWRTSADDALRGETHGLMRTRTLLMYDGPRFRRAARP